MFCITSDIRSSFTFVSLVSLSYSLFILRIRRLLHYSRPLFFLSSSSRYTSLLLSSSYFLSHLHFLIFLMCRQQTQLHNGSNVFKLVSYRALNIIAIISLIFPESSAFICPCNLDQTIQPSACA